MDNDKLTIEEMKRELAIVRLRRERVALASATLSITLAVAALIVFFATR